MIVAVGMGLIYAGYTVSILGYCWVRGYAVTFTDLFRQTWPGVQAAEQPAGSHKLKTITGNQQVTS